jgi:hypothetical protein
LWREAGVASVADFVSKDPEELLTILKAAQLRHKAVRRISSCDASFGGGGGRNAQMDPLSSLLYTEHVISTRYAMRLQAKEAADKAAAAAEESGEELTTELRKSAWRYRVLGMAMGGDSLEAAESDLKNIQTYDGPLQPQQVRTYGCARVQFGGEKADTYFGAYEEDVKSGPGIYCYATGAFYVGQYKVRAHIMWLALGSSHHS